jgi:3',5'-cyclic AMP phosphodiesterase CpdA
VTRIAHLTDPHLNGTRERHGRLLQALRRADASGADHLLLTGDLTANGHMSQFEELSQALFQSRFTVYDATLVPGNHDGGPGRWVEALNRTQLRAFAPTSFDGATTDKGDVVIAAVDSTIGQRAFIFRALGHLTGEQLDRIDRLGERTRKCLVLAVHHGVRKGPLFLFDGMTNGFMLRNLLEKHPHMHVCCGHHHRIIDSGRMFAAGSVVNHPDPLRVYDVRGTQLVPIYQSAQAIGAFPAPWG